MSPARETALDLLRRFPDASTHALARIALKQNPTLFLTHEQTRSLFRNLRGANGVSDRRKCSIKTYYRKTQMLNVDPFAKIPAGKAHFKDWKALQIDGPLRALVLSDLHIPYHHRSAVMAALKHGQKCNVNTVVLNGDIADFFSVSFWEKDPRKRLLKDEIETVRAFLMTVKELFPRARIIFKEGNHEERWFRYLSVKAPEIVGMADFELPAVLNFDAAGIDVKNDYIKEKRPIRLGTLNVIHGHEYRFAISNPVSAARGLYLRAKAYAMCGHFHMCSQHAEKNLEGKNIATWSTGCLCELHPDYAVLNNWSHGFAVVEVSKDGKFQMHNHFIAHSKVF